NREGKRWKGCRSLPAVAEREISPRFLMTLSSALYLTSSVFAGAGSPRSVERLLSSVEKPLQKARIGSTLPVFEQEGCAITRHSGCFSKVDLRATAAVDLRDRQSNFRAPH
ncbi:hypothetical protein, partial [Mesorhizobium sp.]|uniref:hypothetical protein n=1 Tax=Mesorhizobium sp. TaxID=1871066 RepID=UPI0025E71E5D